MAVIPDLMVAVYPTDFEGRITMQDIIDTLLANGGGAGAPVTWANIGGRPAVVAAGADQAAARLAIGAGTSSLVIGTSASQAAAGNHAHANYALGADLTALAARVTALEAG